jgi:uncharacterized protein
MLRLLLIVLAVWIALLLVRDVLRRRRGTARPPAVTATVRCAHCGVHLPEADALQHVDGRSYCSIEHARGDD